MQNRKKKRPVGRPRKPNRTYSGPLQLAQIETWSGHLSELDGMIKESIARLRAAELSEVHVFGREIKTGLARIEAWTVKLQASVTLAVRQKAAGEGSDTPPI